MVFVLFVLFVIAVIARKPLINLVQRHDARHSPFETTYAEVISRSCGTGDPSEPCSLDLLLDDGYRGRPEVMRNVYESVRGRTPDMGCHQAQPGSHIRIKFRRCAHFKRITDIQVLS